MLSVEECRNLLGGGSAMDDDVIVRLRDLLYEVAGLALDVNDNPTRACDDETEASAGTRCDLHAGVNRRPG